MIKVMSGIAQQPAADTTYNEVIRIPVNSFSGIEPPVLKPIFLQMELDQAQVENWGNFGSFKFSIYREPLGQKPVGYTWSFASTAAWQLECTRMWYPPANIPFVTADTIRVVLTSSGTTQANKVTWLLYYEEVEKATELQTSLAVMI
jgi:hypothetical protein